MTEDELQRKRAEYRDQEVNNKISQYSQVAEYRQQVLKVNYTSKSVDKSLTKMGWFLVLTHVVFLVFFCTLFVFSYIPHTKKIVAMVLP